MNVDRVNGSSVYRPAHDGFVADLLWVNCRTLC